MPATVTIDGNKIGRIERTWANEDELYSFIIAWCVARSATLDVTITVGSSHLHCLTQNATYHIDAGYEDGGWLSIGYVSG